MTYLIAALGVCIGITAGLLGAGPSILTVLLLKHVAGLDLGSAIVTALLVVGLMSIVAAVPHAVAGAVSWRCAGAFGVASMTGAYLTGRLSALIPERALLLLFLLAMVVAAAAMFLQRTPGEAGGSCPRRLGVAVLAAGGLLVGSVTGLVGLGGGFAVVPLLVLFARTPVRSAIGTSIVVIAMNTLAGFVGHLPHPRVDWPTVANLGVAECAGSLLGAVLSRRVSAEVLRRAFAVLMLLAAVFMLSREILR